MCCKEENWQDKSKMVLCFIGRFYNPLQFQVGMLLLVSGSGTFYKHQFEYRETNRKSLSFSWKLRSCENPGQPLPLSAVSTKTTQRILKHPLWEKGMVYTWNITGPCYRVQNFQHSSFENNCNSVGGLKLKETLFLVEDEIKLVLIR